MAFHPVKIEGRGGQTDVLSVGPFIEQPLAKSTFLDFKLLVEKKKQFEDHGLREQWRALFTIYKMNN